LSRTQSAHRIAMDARRVARVYSVLARVYDDFFDWALGPGRRRAIGRLDVREGDHVLEVGVGTGLSLPEFPQSCRITGIDISEPMLERARQRVERIGRQGVELRLMDARELHLADASFDHVLAPYVMSVVPEPERVMAEISRVCKPGGTVIVVNQFGSRFAPLALLERWLTPISQWIGFRLDLPLATVTEAAGLELVSVERVNLLGGWRLVVLRRRAD